MSQFDPDLFLSQEVKGENATSYTPIPEMESALLVCKEVKVRVIKGGSIVMDVHWIVDEQEARDATGQDEPIIRQGVFLDIDSHGALEMGEGKNVNLGRVRAAIGQNDKKAWAPSMIIGAVCRGQITQRPDPKDAENIFNDVKALCPA